jgi:hypothetical protein
VVENGQRRLFVRLEGRIDLPQRKLAENVERAKLRRDDDEPVTVCLSRACGRALSNGFIP